MVILRKSLKAYVLAVFLFLILTLVLAALIRFTPYAESWTFAGLVAILSITTLFLGSMEGRITERKGLLTGFLSAVLFVFLILFSVGSVFAVPFTMERFDILYLLPLLAGAVGGIVGANSGKSLQS